MKMLFILVFVMIAFCGAVSAQNYNNIVNYNYNATPAHGVKIKTNLPFTPGSQMPTIIFQGYNYGSGESMGLMLTYYVYSGGSDFYNPSNFYFHNPQISSFGNYAPAVFLSSEDGKVIIYINDKSYYQRFTVSAYAQGMGEQSSHFQGWTVVDEPLAGVKTVEVPYKSKLAGNVSMPGVGIWNADGSVGIGTTSTRNYKLAVNGSIRAQEIKVEASPWPDYVFESEYELPSLNEVKQFIKENKHLPEIPSASEVEKDGINLGEMNARLLKKIEELTLYMIEHNKDIQVLKTANEDLKKELSNLKSKLK